MSDFNSVLYSILGRRLKDQREDLGLSQLEVSQKISENYPLKRSSISNIENGRQQAPIHILYEYCRVLNIDVQTILPTYAEVKSLIKVSEPKIDKFINSMEIDDKLRAQINSAINKTKKS